jgi:hypothetical protein
MQVVCVTFPTLRQIIMPVDVRFKQRRTVNYSTMKAKALQYFEALRVPNDTASHADTPAVPL